MTKGIVVQFRRGRKTVKERHFLLNFGAEDRTGAEKLVGKDVVWTSPAGKKIRGKIAGAHGSKGLVRAIFEKGLPGQAVTTEVEILDSGKEEKKNAKDKKEKKPVKRGKK